MEKYKIILFLVSFGLLGFVVWNSDPYTLFKLLSTSTKIYILAGVLVSLFVISLRVLKWRVLLDGISFADLYPVQLFGMTVSNFTPGKIGEPFKAVVLKMVNGASVSKTLPTILWERILDIIVLVGFSVIIINFVNVESFAYPAFVSILLFLTVVLFFLLILKSRKFGTKVFNIIKKIPFLKNISQNFINTFYDNKVRRTKIILSFLITGMVWLFEGFVFYFAFLSLGVNINPIFFSSLIAVSILVAIASSLPGGIGPFEAVSVLVLTNIGIETSLATAGVLLYRFMSFLLASFIGGLSFIYLSRKFDISKMKSTF